MDFYKDMDPEVAVGFQALPVPEDETGIDWMPPNLPASENAEISQRFLRERDDVLKRALHPPPPPLSSSDSPFSLDTTLRVLLADDGARAVLDLAVPDLVNSPSLHLAEGFSLRQLAAFEPHMLDEHTLRAIAAAFEQLAQSMEYSDGPRTIGG